MNRRAALSSHRRPSPVGVRHRTGDLDQCVLACGALGLPAQLARAEVDHVQRWPPLTPIPVPGLAASPTERLAPHLADDLIDRRGGHNTIAVAGAICVRHHYLLHHKRLELAHRVRIEDTSSLERLRDRNLKTLERPRAHKPVGVLRQPTGPPRCQDWSREPRAIVRCRPPRSSAVRPCNLEQPVGDPRVEVERRDELVRDDERRATLAPFEEPQVTVSDPRETRRFAEPERTPESR